MMICRGCMGKWDGDSILSLTSGSGGKTHADFLFSGEVWCVWCLWKLKSNIIKTGMKRQRPREIPGNFLPQSGSNYSHAGTRAKGHFEKVWGFR